MSKIDLIHGDAIEEMKKIADWSVDMVLTDPPYVFDKGTNGGGGMLSTRKSHNEIHTNLGGKNLDVGVDVSFFEEIKRLFKPKLYNVVTFCNSTQLPQLLDFANKNDFLWNILIWHKTNPIPTCNNKYLDDIEYIFQMKERGGKKIGGTYKTKSKVYSSQVNKSDKKLYGHPTIKPIKLMEKLVENHSNEDDTILDPFMGSGTTGVACKQTNRNFIGIELDETYFNIAKGRIENTPCTSN